MKIRLYRDSDWPAVMRMTTALLEAAEPASDSLLDNMMSQRAHAKAGYEEVERAVRFRKYIGG